MKIFREIRNHFGGVVLDNIRCFCLLPHQYRECECGMKCAKCLIHRGRGTACSEELRLFKTECASVQFVNRTQYHNIYISDSA